MAQNNKNLKDVDVFRMVLDDHVCPYGEKAINLLQEKGIDFTDHHLTSREEVDNFKMKHDVQTTPQIFSKEKRIGGYSDLAKLLEIDTENSSDKSYLPVITVFSVAMFMAIAESFSMFRFMGFSLCLLSLLKLMKIRSFAKAFQHYDMLSKILPSYAFIFPFLELFVGLGFLANSFHFFVGMGALILGSLGTYSIYTAVYVEEKDLNCACVGGDTNVPLGAVSITENIIMTLMGIWFLF